MRASLGLPTHRVDVPELVTAAGIAAIAAAAEDAGFDAVFVTEHPFPGDGWLGSGGHHALDPFIALAFAATATRRLRLQTNLVVPSYRNPFLLAKSAASLDHLSGGRLILGIGSGYLEPEFQALGVDYGERNDLTDEAIVAMRAAWTGRSVTMTGLHWKADANTMLPPPVQQPGPPIWIGGNSGRAMRRAVELADGWTPMATRQGMSSRVHTRPIGTVEDLAARIDEAKAHAAAVGRTAPLEVAFNPAGGMGRGTATESGPRLVEHATELAAAGVTFLNAGVPGSSLDEIVEGIAWYGEHVLPVISALTPA